MIASPLPLLALIVAVTALGFGLEARFAWAQRIGASLLVIAFGALLSNLGLVPASSPVYGAITGPVTSLAIVWLLFAVDLRDLKLAGPRMLGAFALAAVATACGALAAALIFHHHFGDDAWRLAGVMTGTYAGGSLNFVAVGRALALPDALFAAATAADNVLTALWMGATLMLPLWLARFYPPPPRAAGDAGRRSPNPLTAAAELRPFDLLALFALGLGLLVVADAIAGRLPAVPAVIWLTTLALAAGQLRAVRRLAGSLKLGLVALNLFFAVIGIGSRFADILRVGLEVFYFTAVVVLIHGLLTFGGARLLRLDAGTTAVASQAAVGGPSTAMALAVARGYKELALPGVAVGLAGYAVGTYAGLAIAALLRALWAG